MKLKLLYYKYNSVLFRIELRSAKIDRDNYSIRFIKLGLALIGHEIILQLEI